MTRKKASASSKKELRATIKTLRSKLDRADETAQRLKGRVARVKKTNTELEARVKRLKKDTKRWEKASRPDEPRTPPATNEPSIVTASTVASSPVSPDAGWTVAQLRAEARSRGVTGHSRMTKTELLAALG